MNKNIVIGIIVLALLGGGYFLVTSMNAPAPATEATSTAPTTGDTTNTPNTPEPAPAPTASAPSVFTDTAVEPTNSTAVVTGKVTPNGASTTYWYEYGQSATFGNQTTAQTVGSGWSAIASPAYITGLKANTLYYVRLSARNAYGTVNGTTYSFSTNNNPPGQGLPPAVSTDSATNVARTAATLRASINPHSSPTTYWFEYGTSANFGSVTAFALAGSGNTSTSVSTALSGLSPLTKYYFRVNAQNQYDTVNGATQTFTTSGPAVAAVAVVTTDPATAITATASTLHGTVNPSGAQTTYWFEYATDKAFSTNLQTTKKQSAGSGTKVVSIAANIRSLHSGTTYYFRTVAQNAAGMVTADYQTLTTK